MHLLINIKDDLSKLQTESMRAPYNVGQHRKGKISVIEGRPQRAARRLYVSHDPLPA